MIPTTGLINVDRPREEPAQWSRSGKCFVANACVCVRVCPCVCVKARPVAAARPPPVASFIPIFEQSLHHHHLTVSTRHPFSPVAYQLHLVRILLRHRDVSFVRLQRNCFIQASQPIQAYQKSGPKTAHPPQPASQPVARPRTSTYSIHLPIFIQAVCAQSRRMF